MKLPDLTEYETVWQKDAAGKCCALMRPRCAGAADTVRLRRLIGQMLPAEMKGKTLENGQFNQKKQ